nr:hypothetical protein [Tanacetum cinerariifolium]
TSGPTINVAEEAFNEENVSKHSNDPLLSESLGEEDTSKQGRIADIDVDKEITLVDETAKDHGRMNDEEMFDTGVLDHEEVVVEK